LIPRLIVHPPKPPAGWRAADWYLEPAIALGAEAAEPGPCVASPEEKSAAADLLARLPRGFLALHPGSGSPRKNWPGSGFAALVRAVSPDRPWLCVEGPADAEACAPLRALSHPLSTKGLPIRVLGAVLAQAGVYVGNDSGVSHLAAVWGAPAVTLFGPTDPDVWAPRAAWVEVVRAPNGDLGALTVEAVQSAIAALDRRRTCGT
jgi:ADP-heptose:LPS heptosyltransferase